MRESRGVNDLLFALPVAALLVDGQGRISRTNAALRSTLGAVVDAFPGRPFVDAFPGISGLSALRDVEMPPEGDWMGSVTAAAGGATAASLHARRLTGDGHGSSVVALITTPTEAQAAAMISDLETRLQRLSPIRHEINNQLMGLLGHSELLRDDPQLPAALRGRCEAILEHCRRIEELARRLGELYR